MNRLEMEIKSAYQQLYQGKITEYIHTMGKIEELCVGLLPEDPLLGEVKILQAMLVVEDMDQRISLYEDAIRIIGGKSRFLSPDKTMIYGNYQIAACCLKKSGTADQVSEKLKRAGELYSKLSGGDDESWILYQAGLHYYRGELDQVEKLIKEMLKKEREMEDGISIGIFSLMCDVAKHQNYKDGWNFGMSCLDLAQHTEDSLIRQMASIVKAMSYLSVGLITEIPERIQSGALGIYMTEVGYATVDGGVNWYNVSSAMVAYIEYCTYVGEMEQALQAIDAWQILYNLKGNLIVDIYAALFRAVCWKQLKHEDFMRQQLQLAVELIAPDRLWMILTDYVTEFQDELWSLVEPYGEDASHLLHTYGDEYRKNLENMRKGRKGKSFFEGLTKREGEIATLVAKGKTNPEIAKELNISQRTVKYHVLNVYGKLNINRRAKVSEALKQREHKPTIWAEKK